LSQATLSGPRLGEARLVIVGRAEGVESLAHTRLLPIDARHFGLSEVVEALVGHLDCFRALRHILAYRGNRVTLFISNCGRHPVSLLRCLHVLLHGVHEWLLRSHIELLLVRDRLRAQVESASVQIREVGSVVIFTAHIQLVELRCDFVRRLLASLRPWDLLSHQAVFVPVVLGELASIFEIVEDLLAERAQFACEGNLGCINLAQINLARLFNDVLGPDVLVGRLVLGVERTILADVPVLDSHEPLITVFSVLFVEFIDCTLVNGDFVYSLSRDGLRRANLDIDLRAQGAEAFVEQFLTAQGVVRIEDVEGLHVELVSTGDYFGQKIGLFFALWLLGLRASSCRSLESLQAVRSDRGPRRGLVTPAESVAFERHIARVVLLASD